MDVVKVTKPKTLGALLAHEYDNNYCRERVALLAGAGAARTVMLGMLAMLAQGALSVASAADSNNTGNGVLGSLTVDAGAKLGAYRVVFIEPATNAGTFQVIDPDGVECNEGTVGVAYDGPINFTIADGATDFVSGDGFTVTVSAPTKKVVQWDGVGQIRGLVTHDATAPDGVDGAVTLLRRGPATVIAAEFVWHAGVTNAQKAAAYDQLDARGIVTA